MRQRKERRIHLGNQKCNGLKVSCSSDRPALSWSSPRSCGEVVHKQKYSISQVRDTAQTRASDNFVIQLDVIDIDSGSRGSPFNVKFYSGIFSLVTVRQTLKPRHTKFSQVWNNMERVHNRGASLDCKCIESTLVFKLDTKTSPWMMHHHSYTNETVPISV